MPQRRDLPLPAVDRISLTQWLRPDVRVLVLRDRDLRRLCRDAVYHFSAASTGYF